MKKGQGKQMLLGLVAVFALFQWVASELGSMRGEAGVIVGLVVVGALLIVQRLIFDPSFTAAAKSIGLGRPTPPGIVVSIVIVTIMLLGAVVFSWLTVMPVSLYPEWEWLIVGLFFQAGVAEEALFRGYLFGLLRQRHTFGKAVFFAAIPFVLVHLILFCSLPWPIAGVSILLAIAISLPLSKLFEMGGDTIWPPAIVHFATQAIAKMPVVEGDGSWLYPFFVIAVSAVAPLIVYLVPLPLERIGSRPLRPTANFSD